MGERKGEKRRGEELSVIFDKEFGILFETEAQDIREFAKVFVVERFQGTGEVGSGTVVGMEGER